MAGAVNQRLADSDHLPRAQRYFVQGVASRGSRAEPAPNGASGGRMEESMKLTAEPDVTGGAKGIGFGMPEGLSPKAPGWSSLMWMLSGVRPHAGGCGGGRCRLTSVACGRHRLMIRPSPASGVWTSWSTTRGEPGPRSSILLDIWSGPGGESDGAFLAARLRRVWTAAVGTDINIASSTLIAEPHARTTQPGRRDAPSDSRQRPLQMSSEI